MMVLLASLLTELSCLGTCLKRNESPTNHPPHVVFNPFSNADIRGLGVTFFIAFVPKISNSLVGTVVILAGLTNHPSRASYSQNGHLHSTKVVEFNVIG
jgi:hypothetical protein